MAAPKSNKKKPQLDLIELDGELLNCYTLSGTLPVWNS